MRILQIEDDAACAQSVELALKAEGMKVETTALGEEGVDLAKVYDYDLILLDLDLPDITGLDVLRRLRAGKITTPVLFVTSYDSLEARVKAFSAGADDFLAKPFHRDELVLRIRAIVRRARGHASSELKVGNLTVNIDRKEALVAGAYVHLTGKEYQMLELFALRLDRTLSKDDFMNHLYYGADEPELKIIDVFVCKLRKKLRLAGCTAVIDTAWARGYTLREGAAEVPEAPKTSHADGESASSRILKALRTQKGARDVGFIAELIGDKARSLRNPIGSLITRGLLESSGYRGQGVFAIYSLTDAGRNYLDLHYPLETAQ